MKIDLANETLTGFDGKVYHKDDVISLSGGKGIVMEGAVQWQKR